MTESPFDSWFDARRLYRAGVPEPVTTALGVFPGIRGEVAARIAAIGARRVLEVGPGAVPLAPRGSRTVFLDVAPRFLAGLGGAAVLGDVLAAPFRDGAFDLAIAADVFTHVRPELRERALGELARLAPRLALFNPEPGTPEVEGSAVPTDALVRALVRRGFAVQQRAFRARAEGRPDFTMALLMALRPGRERETP